MTEPSALTYARYFALTRDYWETDLSQHLEYLHSASSHCGHHDDHRELSQTLLSVTEKHTFTATEDNEEIPLDVVDYLKQTLKPEEPDFEQVYRTLLSDRRQKQNYRLAVPLLSIGGGDVSKDVRKIRRGIDLGQALDDVLEDCEYASQYSRQKPSRYSLVTTDQIQKIVRRHLQQATRPQTMPILSNIIRYVSDATIRPSHQEQRFSIIQNYLPASDSITRSSPSYLNETEFSVESESEQDVVKSPVQSPLGKTVHDNSYTDTIKHGGLRPDRDSLSYLEAVFDEDVVLTQPVQSPIDVTNDHPQNGLCLQDSLVTVVAESTHTSSRKRRKLTHNTAPPLIPELQQNTNVIFYNAIRPSELPHLKIPVISLEPVVVELPDIGMQMLAKGFCSSNHILSPVYKVEPSSFIPHIPPHSISDIFKPELPKNMSIVEKFLGKQRKCLKSDQILWKEPGFRLLDYGDEECEQLDEACFNVEEEVEKDAKLLEQDTISNHFRPAAKCDNENRRATGVVAEPDKCNPPNPSAQVKPSRSVVHAINKLSIDTKNSPNSSRTRLSVLPIKQYAASPLRHITMSVSDNVPTPSASDSLASFMELRGKQFRPPLQKLPISNMEIDSDPIQCSQFNTTRGCNGMDLESTVPPQSPVPDVVQLELLPDIEQCERPTIVFLNHILLKQKPLLIQFLENQVSDTFSLIYRDLNGGTKTGPDLILNPTTCLFITNSQLLNQRPLPGQVSQTGLSPAHDQMYAALEQYDCIFVLVHFVIDGNNDANLRVQRSQSEFTSFCCDLTSQQTTVGSSMIPIWLPCFQASSTSELVNAWIWRIVRQHGYLPRSQSQHSAQGALIDDVTFWELLLVKAGLNPMAAQVVISLLKPPTGMTEPGVNVDWGLRRLMQMNEEERHHVFDSVIGQRAVARLCEAVSR